MNNFHKTELSGLATVNCKNNIAGAKTVYVTFSLILSKIEELSMYLSSAFDDILHKPAIKKPTITPAESHAGTTSVTPFSPFYLQ